MKRLRHGNVCLRFFGDDLDPNRLTERLGGPPTRSWKKGELWSNKGVGALRASGGWIHDGDWHRHPEIGDQIEALLAILTPDEAIWRDLAARFTADFYCGLFLKHQVGESGFDLRILTLLTRRGLGLNLVLYERDDRRASGG